MTARVTDAAPTSAPRAMPKLAARFPDHVWRHPLLASIDARGRAELESAGSVRVLASDEELFSAGEPADVLYVVLAGEIALRANGRKTELRRAGVGDAIGEEAAARAHASRRHDATSVGASEVAALPAALMRRVMARGDDDEGGRRTRRWLVRALASDALERADFSRDLPAHARDVMLDAGRAVELRRGDVLFREGDAAREVFFLAEGIVQLACREDAPTHRVLAYHRDGDFFGDDALDTSARDATATATSDAWIFAVRADVVRELADAHPDALARALRVQTAARARQGEIRENATRHILADLHRFETSHSLLAIDQSACVRCGHCSWSCAQAHDDGVSRLLRRGDVVVAKVRGERKTLLLPSSCQHCKNPACMIDCPTGAISRDARGEVHIREELCTGCGSCAKACPWDNIQMAPRDKVVRLPIVRTESTDVAIKCDLCRDRGGEAACVAACPADAIVRIDPRVELDDVRAVLDRRTRRRRDVENAERPGAPATQASKTRASRSIVFPAVIASSVFVAVGAFTMLEGASRGVSGVVLLAIVASLFGYAIVKRFGVRVHQRFARLVAARAHFIVHVALGTMSLGVAAAHTHGASALAVAFWGAAAFGALAAAIGWLAPRRLARIERAAVLPEELAEKIGELDARAFRDLSGKSDLVKGLYAQILRPFSRSSFVLLRTCALGPTQRAMRDRLIARVSAIVESSDERLGGLEGVVALVVERQALRAQRVLTAALRGSVFVHVVVATALALLVVLHVIDQLRS